MIRIRPATPADARHVAAIHLASRRAFMPYALPVHPDDDVHRWVRDELIPSGGVRVAESEAGRVIGYSAIAVEHGMAWLNQLYLDPAHCGQGIGTQLLQRALEETTRPLRLYTFQPNTGARRFYERHGFMAIAFGDGSGNEEACPDVLYERHDERRD